MNTQLGVEGKVVSTFLLVESTKNFLIYLIASPRAIWYPCLDRCVSFSLPSEAQLGRGLSACPERITEASNLVTLSRSWTRSAISCTSLRTLAKASSWNPRTGNLKLSSWELLVSWGSAQRQSLPSMYRTLEHNSQHQNPTKRLALCSRIAVSMWNQG